ncbi:MAG: DUF1670 domain-containing protein [Desulfobulbaceae bacterium]|nr:DUF1670 domain-containing protein [Desulfobulbaceae bacterium]
MKKKLDHNRATFNPAAYKNFSGALCAFYEQECPQIGGIRTRQVLVQSVLEMVDTFYPETTHLRQGQITWTTVDKDENGAYGKRMDQTRLTNVTLDLVQLHDAKERAEGKKLKDIKQEAAIRLCNQAYEQGGCMTNAEVAILLKISPNTVSKYIRTHEAETNTVIPRRGSIHDMGPTLTHKRIIIRKLYLEGKSVEQTSKETYHSPEAIHRYIKTFKQVLLCRTKQFTPEEICFAVKISKRLLQQYQELIDEMAMENSVIYKQLLNESIMD